MGKTTRRPIPDETARAIREGLAGRKRKPHTPEMKQRVARAMKLAEADEPQGND
jgi:hypothetical protein